MHIKNFSLIYPLDGMTLLGSAYDLLSTRLLIPAEVDPEEMALPLNGKKSKIQLEDFEKFSQAAETVEPLKGRPACPAR